MKLGPHDQRVMERLAPGALCRDGFLGDDPRPFHEIIDADSATVESLGLTHDQIADTLERICKHAAEAAGAPVHPGEGLTAAFRESMGRIPCPWGGHGVFPKGEVELRDEKNDRTLRFTPLSVHLIRRHGFYEGRGGRYRIEPAQAAELTERLGGPSSAG